MRRIKSACAATQSQPAKLIVASAPHMQNSSPPQFKSWSCSAKTRRERSLRSQSSPDDTPPCEKKTRAYRYIFFSACACMQNGVLAPLAPLPAKPADSVFFQSALRLPQVRNVPNRRRWEKERVPAARLKNHKCACSHQIFLIAH